MPAAELRIFSYLPNPRIFKATIAARLCDVTVEVRGASPPELAEWLWDFDARPLDDTLRSQYADAARKARTGFGGTLYKTDGFLAAHPYGTVPAAFGDDGETGVFESNSIMRAVARLGGEAHGLYGRTPLEAARIDGFLDTSLVFARDSQIYLLALMNGELSEDIHARTRDALHYWLGGIEQGLGAPGPCVAGRELSLADICYAAERTLLMNEKARRVVLAERGLEALTGDALDRHFPRAAAHFENLRKHDAFAPDIEPYLEKINRAAERRAD